MKENASKLILEIVCLSNEIRHYVRNLSRRIGITVNEFMILSRISLYGYKTDEEIKKKLYMSHISYKRGIEGLIKKNYLKKIDDKFYLTEKGVKVVDEFDNEKLEFFNFLFVNENDFNDIVTVNFFKELKDKVAILNLVEKDDSIIH